MRARGRVKTSFQKPGLGPSFHILRIHIKIDEKWMQMIQRERCGGLQGEPTSSFSELSHLKALICREARLLWPPLNSELCSLGHRRKVTRMSLKWLIKETGLEITQIYPHVGFCPSHEERCVWFNTVYKFNNKLWSEVFIFFKQNNGSIPGWFKDTPSTSTQSEEIITFSSVKLKCFIQFNDLVSDYKIDFIKRCKEPPDSQYGECHQGQVSAECLPKQTPLPQRVLQ